MGKRGPKTFSEEFRREAVRLATDSEGDRALKDIAEELGISATTLRVWVVGGFNRSVQHGLHCMH